MDENQHHHLQILGQLAREYHEKFAKLEAVLRETPPEEAFQKLRVLGELTTDRFRGAQQVLFGLLAGTVETDNEQAIAALTALCRCFDEMRILCQLLLERNP